MAYHWMIPNRKDDENLVPASFKADPAWLMAVKEYARRQSKLCKKKISIPTVFMTLSLDASPGLTLLYKKYKKQLAKEK